MASVYRQYKREARPEDIPGFCKVATIDEIREHNYALTPGRYVGAEEVLDEGEPFEDRFPKLVKKLNRQFEKSNLLQNKITDELSRIADEL